jgi:hypothetical protein
MKKCIVLALFLLAGFPLFAQSYFFIQPVRGVGKGPEDNAFFAGSLAQEVTANNHFITGNQNRADFIITPELEPVSGRNLAGQLFLLRITIADNRTKKVITEQELIYSSLENADQLLKVLVGSAFSGAPEVAGAADAVGAGNIGNIGGAGSSGNIGNSSGAGNSGSSASDDSDINAWRGKWLYLGGTVFWNPRIHYGNAQSIQLINFGGGISGELHFLNFMSVETSATLATEWIGIQGMVSDEYLNWILEVPVLLKFVFKPAAYYMIEPYGGIHVNIPLSGVGQIPLLSWRAGFQYGVKAGKGIIFIDPCFSMDLGSSSVTRISDNVTIPYNRYLIYLSAGYKFGFFTR